MRLRTTIARLAGAAMVGCLAAGLAASCGTSGTATPTTPGTTASTPPTVAPAVEAELLTLADLPAGWSLDPARTTTGSLPSCFRSAQASLEPAQRVSAAFRQGDSLPTFAEQVEVFADAQGATAGYATVTGLLAGCGEMTFSAGSYTFQGRLAPASAPPVGDRRSAYQVEFRTTVAEEAVTTTFDFVVVQRARTVLVLVYATLNTPPAGAVASLTERAASKLT